MEKDLKWYQTKVDKIKNNEWMVLVHHRMASVWAVNLNNSHPFFHKWFALMQNWTSKTFFNKYKDTYKKETDSECLLHHIVKETNSLEEASILLEELNDTIWIIILMDINKWQVLIYLDGKRESYIDIKDWKLVEFTNYQPSCFTWYENKWYILIDFNMKILDLNFNKELNTQSFIQPTYTTYSNATYQYDWYATPSKWYSNVYDSWYDSRSNRNTNGDLNDFWFYINTVSALIFNGIYTFDELMNCTKQDLQLMNWINQAQINDIERIFSTYKMELVDEFFDDPFYSEEVIDDPIMLFNDIYWYLLTQGWTISQYVYHNLGIGMSQSPKKVLWRTRWKNVKKQYKAAMDEFTMNSKTKLLT